MNSVNAGYLGRNWKAMMGGLVLVAAIIAAYSNALTGPFLYDDRSSILKNRTIRSVWPLTQSLAAPQDTPTAGRPIVNLSFAINYAFGNLNVLGYHLVNVGLHSVNALMLFALIYRTMTRAPWVDRFRVSAWGIAFVVTALWSLHPLQTESVTYVTQRTELLMAFFFLSTMYSARRAWDAKTSPARYAWQALSVVCCGLGMASKEVMVVAPVLVLLYDLSVLEKPLTVLVRERRWLYIGLIATWGILASLLASSPRSLSVGMGLTITPWEYLTTQAWGITTYLRLTLFPIGLCSDYGVETVTAPALWLPSFVFLVMLLGLTVFAWFRCRVLSFFGAWFFLILAPTSSILPIISEPIAERRMYLPLASVVLFAVCGVVACARQCSFETQQSYCRRWIWSREILFLIALVMATMYGILTYHRNKIFQSEVAFWSDVVLKRPQNSRGFANLGIVHMDNQQTELAKASLEQAIALDPNNADAHCNLGKCLANEEKLDEAAEHYDRAISVNPNLVEAYHNRGILRISRNQVDEAINDFQKAIEIAPGFSPAYVNLGNLYVGMRQPDLAMESYQLAFRWDPQSSDACSNLGVLFAQKGDYLSAITWLERALTIDPRKAEAYRNRGACYAANGQIEQAIADYLQCVTIEPNDASAWFGLAKLYVIADKIENARRCLEQVLKIQPDSEQAQMLLNQLGPT